MTKTVHSGLGIAAMLGFVLIGCGKGPETASYKPDEKPTTATSEKEIPGTSNPNDLSPPAAQARVDAVTLGYALGPDGAVAADRVGDAFAPGETAYLSMDIGDAPAGSVVKAAWFGAGDARVHEESKTIAAGQKYLSFQADTKGWPEGDYRAEVWIGDEKVETESFHIGAKPTQ